MNSIENGWPLLKLKQICVGYKGKKPKQEFPSKENIDLIPYINIQAFEKKIVHSYVFEDDVVVAQPGDLLVVWDGARFGLTGIAEEKGGVGSTLMCLKSPVMLPKFLYYYLQSKYSYINSRPKGVATPHVDPEIFWNIDVPIPSLREQSLIVELLDSTTRDITLTKGYILEAFGKAAQLRASILNDAITGNLTNLAIGKRVLSKAWDLVSLNSICDVIDPNPKHRNPKYVDSGYFFLSTANFSKTGGWDLNDTKWVEEDVVKEQEKRCKFTDQTIVFSRKGTIGKVRYVPRGIRFAFLDSLVAINPKQIINDRFLFYCLKSRLVQRQVEQLTRGVALKQISVGAVRSLKIPLPSLKEQESVVTLLDDAMNKLKGLEEYCSHASKTIEDLPANQFSEAFSGELTKEWRKSNASLDTMELVKQIQSIDISKNKPKKPVRKLDKVNHMAENRKDKKKIVDILSNSSEAVSAQDLFKLCGYSNDAVPIEIEDFFLDLRSQLLDEKIEKQRVDEQDFFSIVKLK